MEIKLQDNTRHGLFCRSAGKGCDSDNDFFSSLLSLKITQLKMIGHAMVYYLPDIATIPDLPRTALRMENGKGLFQRLQQEGGNCWWGLLGGRAAFLSVLCVLCVCWVFLHARFTLGAQMNLA